MFFAQKWHLQFFPKNGKLAFSRNQGNAFMFFPKKEKERKRDMYLLWLFNSNCTCRHNKAKGHNVNFWRDHHNKAKGHSLNFWRDRHNKAKGHNVNFLFFLFSFSFLELKFQNFRGSYPKEFWPLLIWCNH